jgi:heme exporter protein C
MKFLRDNIRQLTLIKKINSPSYIMKITKDLYFFLLFLWITLLIFTIFYSLYLLPGDAVQGENFKIFYVHVPAAWIGVGIYLVLFVFQIIYLISHLKIFDIFSIALNKLGMIYSFYTLISGAIWGHVAWDTPWAWDARLTATLVLFLFYVFFYIGKTFYKRNFKNSYIISLFSLLGIFNIPIIKFSVDWWNTLHQSESINLLNNTLEFSMYFPLLLFFLLNVIFCFMYFCLEIRLLILKEKTEYYDRLYN